VNVDKCADVPMRYQVTGIPNLSLFKNGKLVDHIIGSAPMDALDDFVQKNLL
jgi:thioredoxin 1